MKVFIVIDPPYNAEPPNPSDGNIHTPNDSVMAGFFSFTARNLSYDPSNPMSSLLINPGTDVYYRIYTNQEALQRDAKFINDANDDDTSYGYNKMISLGYQKMGSTRGGQNPLFDENGGKITIKLESRQGDNSALGSISPGNYIPRRVIDKYFYFDTSKAEDADFILPKSGDLDFEGSSSDDFYVNAYAVSVGMDSTLYEPLQSQVLSLGFIFYDN